MCGKNKPLCKKILKVVLLPFSTTCSLCRHSRLSWHATPLLIDVDIHISFMVNILHQFNWRRYNTIKITNVTWFFHGKRFKFKSSYLNSQPEKKEKLINHLWICPSPHLSLSVSNSSILGTWSCGVSWDRHPQFGGQNVAKFPGQRVMAGPWSWAMTPMEYRTAIMKSNKLNYPLVNGDVTNWKDPACNIMGKSTNEKITIFISKHWHKQRVIIRSSSLITLEIWIYHLVN